MFAHSQNVSAAKRPVGWKNTRVRVLWGIWMRGLGRHNERERGIGRWEESFMEGWISGQAQQSHGEITGATFRASCFLAGPIFVLVRFQNPSGCLQKPSNSSLSTSPGDEYKAVNPPAPYTPTVMPRCQSKSNCSRPDLLLVNHHVVQYRCRFVSILL